MLAEIKKRVLKSDFKFVHVIFINYHHNWTMSVLEGEFTTELWVSFAKHRFSLMLGINGWFEIAKGN